MCVRLSVVCRAFCYLLARYALEDLLDTSHSNEGILRRMRSRFPHQVSLALLEGNRELAVDIYEKAKSLPSLVTEKHYQQAGYTANGPLSEGSDLTIHYKHEELSQRILKGMNENEVHRFSLLQERLRHYPNLIESIRMLSTSRFGLTLKRGNPLCSCLLYPSLLSQFHTSYRSWQLVEA